MEYPIDDRCGSCRYWRSVRANQVAFRWAVLIVSTVIPLIAVYADIYVLNWSISAGFVGFFATCVIALVLIAYQPHLYALIKSKVQQ